MPGGGGRLGGVCRALRSPSDSFPHPIATEGLSGSQDPGQLATVETRTSLSLSLPPLHKLLTSPSPGCRVRGWRARHSLQVRSRRHSSGDRGIGEQGAPPQPNLEVIRPGSHT